MKKILSILIVLVMVLSVQAFAAENCKLDLKPQMAASKLGRGITNIATCWGEYFSQLPNSVEKSPDVLSGFLANIVRGTAYTVRRAGVGIYDTATFLFPGGTNYGPVIQPETVFDKTFDTLTN